MANVKNTSERKEGIAIQLMLFPKAEERQLKRSSLIHLIERWGDYYPADEISRVRVGREIITRQSFDLLTATLVKRGYKILITNN